MIMLLHFEVFSVGILIGATAVALAFTLLRRDDEYYSSDDLGYLENIYQEKGGVYDEV